MRKTGSPSTLEHQEELTMVRRDEEENIMDAQIEAMGENVFHMGRRQAQKVNRCVTCGKEANKFKDPISIKEYRTSGMCQVCQDQIFSD